MITVYGRKPAAECLSNRTLQIHKLHLAESNRRSAALTQLIELAGEREVDIEYHDRASLSRVSKNRRQDQGVAVDVFCPNLFSFEQWLAEQREQCASLRMIALDGVTNPQNLGMSIRSLAAAGVDAILIPEQGGSGLGPLAIKASAGTAFSAPLLRCASIDSALASLATYGVDRYALAGQAEKSLYTLQPPCHGVFVLGNETTGLSDASHAQCNKQVQIPMQAGVESLNVAVCAALVGFHICGHSVAGQI